MPEPASRPRLLIISPDVIDDHVAGGGLRHLEIARALAKDLTVTLAVPSSSRLLPTGFALAPYSELNPHSLRRLVEAHDVALISGYLVERFAFLHATPTRLIVDMIAPFLLENLHYFPDWPLAARARFHKQTVKVTNQLAQVGDFFICGSERQRDFWLGYLAANQRLNPHTVSPDSDARDLIEVVSFGIPEDPPMRRRPILRDVHPRFGPETKLVLWGGGLWNWLDPITLVRAWPQVLAHHPEARLVFPRMQPNAPQSQKGPAVEQLAASLGISDHTVFLLDWQSYVDREALLCEADVGVVLHPPHLETRFSVRTRVLDYVWAGLPILITEGDVMSDMVRAYGVGRVIPPQDPAAAAAALNDLLERPKSSWADAFAAFAEAMRWTNVVEPLRRYCLTGACAPDRRQRASVMSTLTAAWRAAWPVRLLKALRIYGWRIALARVIHLLRAAGSLR